MIRNLDVSDIPLTYFKKLSKTSTINKYIQIKHFNYAKSINDNAKVLVDNEKYKAILVKIIYYLYDDNSPYTILLWIPRKDIIDGRLVINIV